MPIPPMDHELTRLADYGYIKWTEIAAVRNGDRAVIEAVVARMRERRERIATTITMNQNALRAPDRHLTQMQTYYRAEVPDDRGDLPT